MAQGSLLAPLLPHLLSRYTEDGLARLDVFVDSGSGQHHRACSDDQILVDAHTAPKDDIVFDACHTGNGGMGTNEAVVANVAVVTDLAVVVEFGTTLDNGVGGDATVDAA